MPRLLRFAFAALVVPAVLGCGALDSSSADSSTTTTAPEPTTTTIPPGTVTPYELLLPGQCFDRVPDRDQRRFAVMVIPCEEAHTHELYDSLRYTDADGVRAHLGVSFPGETEVRQRAETLCLERFEPWIGTSWTRSEYDIEAFWPSEDSWASGDRTILCAAYRFDGGTTEGSVRGSGS